MNKIFTITAFILSTLVMHAQDVVSNQSASSKIFTVSLNAMASDPSQLGVSLEYNEPEKHRSALANISYAGMNYNVNQYGFDINGYGFAIELGVKHYHMENIKGLYTANYFSYGSIKFDKNFDFGRFEGTYSYFSLFNPELGYKFMLGNISVDPFLGAMWKIEIKGQGDIDNRYTDEWAVRAGLKIGYQF
ncbi:hypothetical protein [Flavobacterium rhizosphaerae]|uniref:DUF3575 domain-containing protein n=1 Tax=Flavobacterium rhizosphaerae TaxID=3163298 RepID=A0ABW8YYS2_9FLAO